MNAIEQARQWRNEASCGHAAKVAVALLDELEGARNAALREAATELDAMHKRVRGTPIHNYYSFAAARILSLQSQPQQVTKP